MADIISSENDECQTPLRTRTRKKPLICFIESSDSEEDSKLFNKRRKLNTSNSDVDYVPSALTLDKKDIIKYELTINISSDSEEDDKPSTKRKRKITSNSDDQVSSNLSKKVKLEKSEEQSVAKKHASVTNRTKQGETKATKKSRIGIKAPRTSKKLKNEEELAVQSEDLLFTGMEWDVAEVLAQMQELHVEVANNVIQLLDEDNTIPFIARYRKELTNNMEPEQLRTFKDVYENLKAVKQKAATIMKGIAKLGKLTPKIESCIRCSYTMGELDHIYAPYKAGSKRTLAEKARQLGLEDTAVALLEGSILVQPSCLVKPDIKGLTSLQEVELGLQHIVAEILSKDRDFLDTVRKIKQNAQFRLESCQSQGSKKSTTDAKDSKKNSSCMNNKTKNQDKKTKAQTEGKFENYFNFSLPVKFLKPHQVLAMNRGEALKVLTVKVVVPDWVQHQLLSFCQAHWFTRGQQYPDRTRLLNNSFKDGYVRLIQPLLVRQTRAELTQTAEHAAVEVFATNLKKLLLSPPLRGNTVMGMDPGFRNGCKLAVLTHLGEVLLTDVIYPHSHGNFNSDADKLKDILNRHGCELIALGNGTACRETEAYLGNLIQSGWFQPLDVKYTIVSEQGVSIYSCSPLAQKEFPNMDPNVISAVSLARRVQDPLCELVKVEPKHLGVGMYQHDVPEKKLSTTLDEVVVECVSFVGMDINTASEIVLRRIAGLNTLQATKIIEWRSTHGPFVNRLQLKEVKGIGPKTFQQCAGFVRIMPETAVQSGQSKSKKTKTSSAAASLELNPLDRTWIHPESYAMAHKFLSKCGVTLDGLGKQEFINSIQSTIQNVGLSTLAVEMDIMEPRLKQVCDGLLQPPDHDLRSQFKEPLFRRGITSLQELQSGDILTGRVQNVTHFGSFVDVGVGRDGLIPSSFYKNMQPHLGDRVEVKVMSVELERKRISLALVRIL